MCSFRNMVDVPKILVGVQGTLHIYFQIIKQFLLFILLQYLK